MNFHFKFLGWFLFLLCEIGLDGMHFISKDMFGLGTAISLDYEGYITVMCTGWFRFRVFLFKRWGRWWRWIAKECEQGKCGLICYKRYSITRCKWLERVDEKVPIVWAWDSRSPGSVHCSQWPTARSLGQRMAVWDFDPFPLSVSIVTWILFVRLGWHDFVGVWSWSLCAPAAIRCMKLKQDYTKETGLIYMALLGGCGTCCDY
jgi:hypothetical protein